MTRHAVLQTRPPPLAPRALAAVPQPTMPAADTTRPRTPVLQHARTPRQLSFDFHRP